MVEGARGEPATPRASKLGRRAVPPLRPSSEAVVERVLDSAMDLLSTKPWNEITVHEICIGASCSHSSLYARFPSKDAILETLHTRYREALLRDAGRVVDEVTAEAGSIEDVGSMLVRFLLTQVVDRTNLLSAGQQDRRLREECAAVERSLAELGERVVLHLVPSLTAREARRRFVTIGRLLLPSALDVARRSALTPRAAPDRGDEVVGPWTDVIVAYLCLPERSIA